MTQQEKILTIMAKASSDQWFYIHEFMLPDLGDLFVGYKAPTRINELEAKYPKIFEQRQEGRFVQRRISWQDYAYWGHLLPNNLSDIVDAGDRGEL